MALNRSLLAQLPPEVRTILNFADARLGGARGVDDARLQRWIDELGSGGRSPEELRNDILANVVGKDRVEQWVRAQNPDVEGQEVKRLVAGLMDSSLTFSSVIEDSGQDPISVLAPDSPITDRPGVVGKEGTVIRSGGRLVKVSNPKGSDEDTLYYVVYEYGGFEFAHEIGGRERLRELFGPGAADSFGNMTTMSGGQFDNSDIAVVGDIDEVIGTDESYAAQIERDLRALGMESLPSWVRDSKHAMTIMVMGTNEGWSAGRIQNELAKTEAFKDRYGAYDAVAKSTGSTDITTVLGEYHRREDQFRAALKRFRGPNTDTSDEYLARILESGWTPEEGIPLLQVERRMTRNPEAVQQLNQVLSAFGMDGVDADGFVDIMAGRGSARVYEAINTAQAFQALATQGVGVNASFLKRLGFGSDQGVQDRAGFTQAARATAELMARNWAALESRSFGLSREDVVAAIFGEANPKSGKTAAEIQAQLDSVARTFAAQSGGFTATAGFLDNTGRLRLGGFGDL